jgi:hypothetical protein
VEREKGVGAVGGASRTGDWWELGMVGAVGVLGAGGLLGAVGVLGAVGAVRGVGTMDFVKVQGL